MRARWRSFLVALGALAGAGCALFPRPEPATGPTPVAVVLEGSAFTRADVRERVAEAVREVTGRTVVADAGTRPEDPRRGLAASLAKQHPHLTGYDWREPRCTAGADVVAALAVDADVVYHVVLEDTVTTRPATASDVASPEKQPRGWRKVVAALRSREPRTVHEEALVGSVALVTFGSHADPPRVPVDRRQASLEPPAAPELLDAGAVVAEALRRLPPTRPPEWERYARRLAASGCPLLALSVAKAHGTGAGLRSVQTAAVERMASHGGQRHGASRPERSCSALCGMHMVELCNDDTSLWIAHRARWESTPCGTRRSESFLADCYREQWDSGTFQDACVGPCEATPEGRERLEDILRRNGCLRD